MKNYKITVAYDGTNFNGWQNQGNTENTIQNHIETVLSKVLREKIEIIASGRTDKGVHAYNQVCNFKTKSTITKDTLKLINDELNNAVVIKECKEVDERFHARYNVKSKTYRVKLLNSKFNNPITRKYVYNIEDKLNLEKMNKAAESFVGEHDFSGFSSLKKSKKTTVRTISKVEIIQNGEEIEILVTGDGFLYNQVRIMAGTLIDIGLNKLKENVIADVFDEKVRASAGHTIPPYCLYLDFVAY